ncbi:tyrosine-type recombinase/integrase [Paenibacillus sp. NPDC058177]|uniref:tyrosine-type recombinase/integrase n=1 Tax=Paenibacillus sp. NPDC058177 TaxID=3346369 RepID=UPI0036D80CC5
MASYKKLATGWSFRLRFKDPFTKEFKEKSQRGFETKKEAQLAVSDFERQLAEGVDLTDLKLKDYMEFWINEYKVDSVRKNTLSWHKNNIKTHINPYFKELFMKEIKPIMYQKFLSSLFAKGLSRRSVISVHTTFNGAMKQAIILGKIEKNPCSGAKVKGEEEKTIIKFIESEHIPSFLTSARQYDYIYWSFFKALIETGMRKGEAAALQWTDINFKDRTIKITKTLDFTAKSSEETFGDTKTYNSKRIITIPQTMIDDLRFHLNYQNQNKLALLNAYNHELNLVFCKNDGNFIPKSSLFNAFSRILKRINISPMPIHSLRHTHAVLQLESGATMKYVQERLGHGSVQITSDVYAHISKKIETDHSERFETHLNKVFEK